LTLSRFQVGLLLLAFAAGTAVYALTGHSSIGWQTQAQEQQVSTQTAFTSQSTATISVSTFITVINGTTENCYLGAGIAQCGGNEENSLAQYCAAEPYGSMECLHYYGYSFLSSPVSLAQFGVPLEGQTWMMLVLLAGAVLIFVYRKKK
jgi:hypothetical protein